MTRVGKDRLLLADMASPRLVSVRYEHSALYTEPLLTVEDFGGSELRDELAAMEKSAVTYQQLATTCLWVLLLWPVLGLLLLYRQGYDLNARVS